MISGEQLMRNIIAVLDKIGDAKNNLTTYLKSHVRSEIIDKMQIFSMLKSLDPDEDIREEAVDMAIENDLAGKLRDNLIGQVAHKKKISLDDAEDVVSSGKRLSDEAGKILTELTSELASVSFRYVSKALHTNKELWKRKKEKEEEFQKEEPVEEKVLPEQEEVEEELKKAPKFEIKDLEKLIDEKYPGEKGTIMKKILHEILINKKTLEEVEKDTGVFYVKVHRYLKELIPFLEKHLVEMGVAKPKKEVHVPDYKEILKNKAHQDDFKDFLEQGKKQRMSERTLKVLESLGKGLDVAEASKETEISVADIRNIKSRYFDSIYKDWYETMQEKTARIAALFFGAEEKDTGTIHEKMVSWALEHNRFIVTVVFESDYDNLDVIKKENPKDPTKDPAHFKYLSYQVELMETRGGKKQRAVEYVYKQRLNDDGTFIGHGESNLKLDGERVSGDDLQEKLDSAVERKIKPEGLLPHKYTGAIYINKKTGKKYHNIHDFSTHFKGIGIWDPKHIERIKKHEDLQLKKMMGVPPTEINRARRLYQKIHLDMKLKKKEGAPDHEIKALQKQLEDLQILISNKLKTDKDAENLLHDIKLDLKVEETKDEKLRDKDKMVIFKEQIKFLENILEERKHEQESIDDIVKQEEMIRKPEEHVQARVRLSESDMIPKPANEAVRGLIELLKRYKIENRPNPNLWLQPDDMVVLAKTLRASIKNKIELELKELRKKKKEDTVEKRQEITGQEEKEVTEALKGFEAYPEDLKKRRDEFEKNNPAGFARLSQSKNTKWVDSAETTDRLFSRIQGILKQPVVEEKGEKQRSVKMLEKVKYTALEAFLKQELIGIGKMADVFANAPIERKLNEKETSQVEMLNNEIEKTTKSIKESQGLLEDFRKSLPKEEPASGEDLSDSEKDVQDLEKDISSMAKYVKRMKDHMSHYKTEPAVSAAKVLQEKTAYFSSLYSVLIGLLWFRHKSIEKAADEPVVDVTEKEGVRKQALHEISVLTSKSIWDRDSIRHSMGRVRALLSKFVGLYTKSASYDDLIEEADLFPYVVISAVEPTHKSLLPADEMHHAQQLVYRLEQPGVPKKMQALKTVAQGELDKMIESLTEGYRQERSTAEIDALAKKKGISPDKAAGYLRKLQDGLARHAFREFIDKWQTIIEKRVKKHQRTDLGNRPSHEYDRMGEFVENHLPELFKLFPPEEEPTLPSAGIPTPKKIREEIENAFSRKKPEEMEEKVDFSELFNDVPMGMGGSEKAKSRSRKKTVKPPPPSAVFEEIKDQVVQLIKTKQPRAVVLTTLAMYTHRLKKFLNSIKDDEHLNVDDVIDGFVALLKHLYYQILKINVEPSGRMLNLISLKPAKKASEEKDAGTTFTGIPDIAIDSAKEAEDLFDKLKEIYKEINHYIAPDQVGVPPESLSNLTKKGIGKKYLPIGLVDWYQKLQEYEGKKVATSMEYTVFRVANSFMENFEDVENIPENDLVMR